LGQGIGTIVGLIIAFAMTFIVLTFGIYIPPQVIPDVIVEDFLARADLELRFAIVGTVLFPPQLGAVLGYGADQTTVLAFVTWGFAGLIAGLLSKGFLEGVLSAVFAAIIGSFATWLIIFFIQTGDVALIFGTASMLILQVTLEGAIWPSIAAAVGGILGGGISRERR
jgi:hypothetical protein